jgi:hypothetical protein
MTMKRWIFFVVLLSLSVLTGCLKMEQEITLNANGSGRVSLMKAMTEQMVTTLKEAEKDNERKGVKFRTSLEFDKKEIRENFKQYRKFGITLKNVKTENRDGWRYVYVNFDFKNFSCLRELNEFNNIILKKNEAGDYVISCGLDSDQKGMDITQLTGTMKTMLQGMRVVSKVNTPTDIISTNAPIRTARSATWIVDFDQDPDCVNRLPIKPEVVFSGRGVDIP